jgi:hypothetical protein
MQGSISDFAESLILQELSDIKSGKVAPPTNVGISTPDLGQGHVSTLDISRVQVPDTLIESLTGVKPKLDKVVKTKPVKLKQIKEETKPSIEEAIVRLLLDISKKLNTLCEMTTTGAIGVSTCDTPAIKPKKKKKKTKSELVRESLRDILNNRHGK